MVALIKSYKGCALTERRNRARSCKDQTRKIPLATNRFRVPPGVNHAPETSNTASSTDGLEAKATVRSAPNGEHPADPGDRAIKLYLREIGQLKRFTPAEELDLVARVRKGDRKARASLIKAKLRLVVEISREYENIGLSLLDLISEGNLGLLQAVERFDSARDRNFSTCSARWIRQSIKRALSGRKKA